MIDDVTGYLASEEYIKGVAKTCPTGKMTHDWWTTETVATHYTSMDDKNEAG